MGRGPTGWGRGPCGRGQGRGAGNGRGRGRGNRGGQGDRAGRIWGRLYEGTDPAADRAALEDQVRMLEGDLAAARQQLKALEPDSEKE